MPERLGVDHRGLGRAAVERGRALQAGQGAGIRLGAVMGLGPGGHQLAQSGVDLLGALRELLQKRARDAGDVGVALAHRSPGNAEAGGELGPQGRGVDPADAALLALQEPGVEGQPLPGEVLRLGGDDGVGVELGSALRLVCWRNTATARPWVSTWWTPSVPRRVSAPWRSNHSRAAPTAESWEASTSARTNESGDSAHRTETDLEAENVPSKARAERSPKPRPSRAPLRGWRATSSDSRSAAPTSPPSPRAAQPSPHHRPRGSSQVGVFARMPATSVLTPWPPYRNGDVSAVTGRVLRRARGLTAATFSLEEV